MATRRTSSARTKTTAKRPAKKGSAKKPVKKATRKVPKKVTAKKPAPTRASAKKPSARSSTQRPARKTARARKQVSSDGLPPLSRAQRPPREVTRDRFLVWRFPRAGVRNPHDLTNHAWVWLARHRDLNAYMANRHFDGPSSLEAGPCWCANRFGQTDTTLPDGRSLAIGGEHEDSYDPDFYIYNDVIVTSPAGEISIQGYPYDVFPPTDFHTATLAGSRVVILGCLGHPSQRRPGHTPAFALDTTSLAITPLVTTGDMPGWIHKHSAELSADGAAVVVHGGECLDQVGDETRFRDNLDDWSLDLATLRWTRLTRRPWTQWDIVREDRSRNHLFEISSLGFYRDDPSFADLYRDSLEQLGFTPDVALYAVRYEPPFAHEVQPGEQGYPLVHTIVVDGITVRYVEDSWHVRVTIEGELDPVRATALLEDARQKLSALERSTFVVRRL